jgi:DNA N-6-adenine-methyltransferase (Dam)
MRKTSDPLPERIKGVVRPEHHHRPNDQNYSESKSDRIPECETAKPVYPESAGAWDQATRNRRYLALHSTAGNQEYYTPPYVFKSMGNVEFDRDVASPGKAIVHWIPARRHFTRADDGLKQNWSGDFVWGNFPYTRSGLPQWLEKFRENGNGVALVVDRTSARWWHRLCADADAILQVFKKIQFLRPPNEPNDSKNALGSSLVAYGPKGVEALVNAARNGLGTLFVPYEKFRVLAERLVAKEAGIAELKARIAALDAENATLKARIDELTG